MHTLSKTKTDDDEIVICAHCKEKRPKRFLKVHYRTSHPGEEPHFYTQQGHGNGAAQLMHPVTDGPTFMQAQASSMPVSLGGRERTDKMHEKDGIGIQFPKTVRAKATEVTMAADKARHLDDTTKTSSANMAPQRPQRTTATVQRPPKSFHERQKMATDRFGVAEVRPQDVDRDLMRAVRRTNLGRTCSFPLKYEDDLEDLAKSIPKITEENLPMFHSDMIAYFDHTCEHDIFQRVQPPPGGFSVLSVDFEFHQEYSYDGFISVASLSCPSKTLVIDCLYESRQRAMEELRNILEASDTLKVFCGCSNDVFRLQKDWECFTRRAVDIQDMFAIWKEASFEDVLHQTSDACKTALKEKNKPNSDSDVRKYLATLNTPSLQFLKNAFLSEADSDKDDVVSLSDWRLRPLHADQIKYSALDSYYTLQIFHFLNAKIGLDGVRKAAQLTNKKLINTSRLPSYKQELPSKPQPLTLDQQQVSQRIFAWRDYVSKNLDKKPDQVVTPFFVERMAIQIEGNKMPLSDQELAGILKNCRVSDKYLDSARLLNAYLEPDGERLAKMRNMICRNCGQVGHVGKFCWLPPDPTAKRQYMKLPENKEDHLNQNRRRHNNWCQKRNLDPATTTCPWESEPYIAKKP